MNPAVVDAQYHDQVTQLWCAGEAQNVAERLTGLQELTVQPREGHPGAGLQPGSAVIVICPPGEQD